MNPGHLICVAILYLLWGWGKAKNCAPFFLVCSLSNLLQLFLSTALFGRGGEGCLFVFFPLFLLFGKTSQIENIKRKYLSCCKNALKIVRLLDWFVVVGPKLKCFKACFAFPALPEKVSTSALFVLLLWFLALV